jgi:hypothetical protein
VRWLLEHGADPDARGSDGRSAIDVWRDVLDDHPKRGELPAAAQRTVDELFAAYSAAPADRDAFAKNLQAAVRASIHHKNNFTFLRRPRNQLDDLR